MTSCGGSALSKLTRTMFTPEPYSSSVCWIRSLTSWLMMPRSRERIGDSSERDTTSRIAELGDGLDGGGRVGEVEEEFRRVADVPHHLEGDVDDVLVAGQHQAGGGAADGARADVLGVLARHLDDLVGDDRPGREVQAGLADAVAAAFAEGELDRLLLGPDRIDRHDQPEADDARARRWRGRVRRSADRRRRPDRARRERPPRPPIRILSCSCPLRTISSRSGTGGCPPGPAATAAIVASPGAAAAADFLSSSSPPLPPPPQGPPLLL